MTTQMTGKDKKHIELYKKMIHAVPVITAKADRYQQKYGYTAVQAYDLAMHMTLEGLERVLELERSGVKIRDYYHCFLYHAIQAANTFVPEVDHE